MCALKTCDPDNKNSIIGSVKTGNELVDWVTNESSL